MRPRGCTKEINGKPNRDIQREGELVFMFRVWPQACAKKFRPVALLRTESVVVTKGRNPQCGACVKIIRVKAQS